MMEVNLRLFFSELNGSRLFVFAFALIFSIFLALKLDGLSTSFFVVFLPVWIGEALIFIGFFTGAICFFVSPPSRADISARNDFFAMCFQTLEHILLLMFQLLLYAKIEYLKNESAQPTWLLVFCPLLVLSFVSMIISAWCVRHGKTFEFEMFFSVNIVQFALISFKLDNGIQWTWSTVFIPTWVLFALFYLGSAYSLLISFFSYLALNTYNRRTQICTLTNLLLGAPLLSFLILLCSKLDSFSLLAIKRAGNVNQMPFIIVGIPLFVFLFSYMLLSFGNTTGNTWWFARKSLCGLLFDVFPCLQHYTNISYKFDRSERPLRERENRSNQADSENIQIINNHEGSYVVNSGVQIKKQIIPQARSNVYFSIESPD